MQNAETIKNLEQPNLYESKFDSNVSFGLDEQQINALFKDRKEQLEGISKFITLKLSYAIEEKLETEKQLLLSMLSSNRNVEQMLEKYSFILDPQYFEQRFLKLL